MSENAYTSRPPAARNHTPTRDGRSAGVCGEFAGDGCGDEPVRAGQDRSRRGERRQLLLRDPRRGRAAAAAARRARLDRHVRAGAADARRRPAGDRRRPARPRPHAARRPTDQPDRHRRRHGRRSSKQLGYEQVDVLGYSFGGGVAFRLAVQHPEMVRRLALVSARLRAGRLLSRRCCRCRRRSARRWPSR